MLVHISLQKLDRIMIPRWRLKNFSLGIEDPNILRNFGGFSLFEGLLP